MFNLLSQEYSNLEKISMYSSCRVCSDLCWVRDSLHWVCKALWILTCWYCLKLGV